jgi:hypothetical protein
MKIYGAVKIWRISHIHSPIHDTTHFQAHPPQCLVPPSLVAAVGGFVCAMRRKHALLAALLGVCRGRGDYCKVPQTNYV